MTPEQIRILEKHARDPFYGNRMKYLLSVKKTKDLKIEKLNKKGISEVGNLSKRDLFLVGIALYWAEGFKKDKQAGFANQDPKMIKLFIKWLKECFDYNDSDLTLRVTLNISHKHRTVEVNNYWSQVTGISKDEFKKPTFQKVKWKKIYENPDEYYGVLRIKVRKSLDFLRKIHGYIEGLKLNSD